jgi:selenide,water dikinase
MRTLNRAAADALASIDGLHACTDVTGFGLLGHGAEVALASGVTLTIDSARVPLFDGVLALVRRNRNAGMDSNRAHFGHGVKVAPGIDSDLLELLYDPQTSGGLLVFVAAENAAAAVASLRARNVPVAQIGTAVAPTGNWIEVS